MDIIINDLSKKYGEKIVLSHYSAVIKEGMTTAVMAPSGGGKTTLLRILAGLEKADAGTVLGIEDKKISMVFQEDRLCSNLSALSNIRLVCGRDISRKQIGEELEKVGLKGSESQPACKLSGGMRRRTALVRALIVPYDLLILDEPFKGLDEENKKTVMDYTKEKSHGKTVIFVTHDEKEAEYLGGNRIILPPNKQQEIESI